MLRTAAVARILYGLGNRPAGTALDDQIILRLQEAQRDLERGKTLPWFLKKDKIDFTVAAGLSSIPVEAAFDEDDPGRAFLRDDDDLPIYFIPTDSDVPSFLKRIPFFKDALKANIREDDDPRTPTVYCLRRSTDDVVLDFITVLDAEYTFIWNYYRSAVVLTSDVENEWLAHAPEWLIGEAGRRIAMDLRNPDAVTLFTEMRQHGRAAIFGDEVAYEISGGQIVMGANL